MMNSSRARPTPSFGSRWNSKASSGLPTFIVILTGAFGMDSSERSMISISSIAAVDEARIAFRAGHRDRPAVPQHLGRVAAADHRGYAQLARDDGGVAGAARRGW